MEHVAIDLGGRESQVCVRSAKGEVIERKRLRTQDLSKYLATREPSVVVMETCAEAFAIADAAQTLHHTVRVVPATLVRALGVGARGIKTDVRDSDALSAASCKMDLPSVHIPTHVSRERKTVCKMRNALVSSRTKVINAVRGWLRQQLIRIKSGTPERFVERLRESTTSEQRPAFIAPMLAAIEALNQQIEEIDKPLIATAKNDPLCRLLMTVPGVGPITSTLFVATVDDAKRFDSAHRLESYLGLAPGENSSSDRKRRTSITKAGSATMRWALVQAAHCARRTKGTHPMVQWSLEVEKRRGRKVALIALARKIAGILFAMLRDGTAYDPHIGEAVSTLATA
jgi:transposase